ncbi:MAG: hypothetical protein Tsb0021_04970 [Chlamydiales bacterium]
MISVIVPTRNRAYTFKKFLSSYYQQFLVKEVVVVDDAGIDDTQEYVQTLARKIRTQALQKACHGSVSSQSIKRNFPSSAIRNKKKNSYTI